MKNISRYLLSRQCLAILAMVAVALAIWFAGPLIAIGDLAPLATPGARILCIALFVAGVLFWLANWPVSIVFVALLTSVIWYASPLLSIGRARPFVSASSRIAVITVLLVFFLGYWLFRLWLRMRSDEQFLKRLLTIGGKQKDNPAASQLRAVHETFVNTLSRLKALRTGSRVVGRLLGAKRYLYALPWYLVIGAPSSGKSSALLRAGLTQARADLLQRPDNGSAQPTAAVDWWLTNEAVLIDTAGPYAQHGTSTHPLADNDAHSGEPSSASSTAAPITVSRQTVDHAEWLGFLGLLRRYRTHAPINGALLTVDLTTLTEMDEHARAAEAAALCARMVELRQQLGIRFPVYLVITKMDRLQGFSEYFGALSTEGRSQPWGFTLPYRDETLVDDGLGARCATEFLLLSDRLGAGLNARLQEEYDVHKRRQLAALSEEFRALAGPLGELIRGIFPDSHYDNTQTSTTLRGVYFTSAQQDAQSPTIAQRRTVVQRLYDALGRPAPQPQTFAPTLHGYFLRDLLTKVVFPEADLVRPNLRWEFRFRLLRVCGHALALLLFVWFAFGLHVSYGNNSAYLDRIGEKARALDARVRQLYKTPNPQAIPDTLSEARYLPTFPGLDLSAPESSYRFGLLVTDDVAADSQRTYAALEDNLLLPQIMRRIETVLSSGVAERDAKTVYRALRVYLMLYDKQRYNADDVRAWVLDDWANADGAAAFGGRASMIPHVEQLFSGERVVQSPFVRNDALIAQARALLDSSNMPDRLYERAKAAMQKEAPDEFTLSRAIGPQAGAVFTRASGAPLSRGVPGLFTLAGYRDLFDKRLPEFVAAAREEDAWVMGKSGAADLAQKKTPDLASRATGVPDGLTESIRRQYLSEYARQWDDFLADIHVVSGSSLAFNLQVLRSLAAPDSPLVRLAQAVVHETTLSQPDGSANSLLQRASLQLDPNASRLSGMGVRAEERVERELVDSHFASLREVTIGSAGAGTTDAPPQSGSAAGKSSLDGIVTLLNDEYTALMVADNALSNNSVPPPGDTNAKLKMAAGTLPAPIQQILLDLAQQDSRTVNQGVGQLLSRQMQSVVGDVCRLTVEGRYPFSPDSPRDVGIDDFTRLFARGGVIDDFFTKTLQPFVDVSAKPWRYKTLPGATEPVQGPDLEPFQHAQAIRDTFFGGQDQKQLAWKSEIRVTELDPMITTLALDIDGQTSVYQHGPVAPIQVVWPGARGGTHVGIMAQPSIRPETSTLSADGPWALLHLLQKGHIVSAAALGHTRIEFAFDGRNAALDVANAGTAANPLTSDVLTTFHCPSPVPTFSLVDTGPPAGLPSAGLPPALPPVGQGR